MQRKRVFNTKKFLQCVCRLAVLLLILNSCAGSGWTESGYSGGGPGGNQTNHANTPTTKKEPQNQAQKSAAFDYVLSRGTDKSGNVYELVAEQEETALGFEIKVGVLKNNEWIYPMSSNFPFLRGDGQFPIEDGTALTRITSAKLVANYIYFVDSGAFAMKYISIPSYEEILEVFNCNTMQTYRYSDDDYKMLYLHTTTKYTSNSVESFDVKSYGTIKTYEDQIIMYKDVSDKFDWASPKKYDWIVLNTRTMKTRTIASNVEDNAPQSSLSEGLFYADDDCFYDLNAQKVIDLSKYNIDVWENGGLHFKNGKCVFIAKNDLGTEFEITIDKSGKVLSEVKK